MAGLFGALVSGIERKDARVLDSLPGFILGPSSKTGIAVSYSVALQVSAVLACCRVIAEGIAQSPCKVFRHRKTGPGSDVARDHPLYRLLSLSPFGGQTAFEFWETIVVHLVLVGNAYVFINRLSSGVIFELLILDPAKVSVKKRADGTLDYEVSGDDGTRRLSASMIWHLRGMSWNGWMGMEPVKLAREAIGLAIALEESHARQHKNGVQPSGVYSVEGPLKKDQFEELSKWIKSQVSGENAGMPLVLDRGAKWMAQQLTGVEQQHIETRKFQIEEICRSLRVMPIMLGVPGAAGAYDNGETMFIAHTTHTLMPLAVRLEQSSMVHLLTPAEVEEGIYVKFNLSAMMRGDYKSRQEGLQIQRRNGVIHADEWRDLEDMNPRDDEGGEQYIVEGNMAIQDGRDLVPVKNIVI